MSKILKKAAINESLYFFFLRHTYDLNFKKTVSTYFLSARELFLKGPMTNEMIYELFIDKSRRIRKANKSDNLFVKK